MLHGVTQARSAIRRRRVEADPRPAWDGKERSLNWPLHFALYFQSLKKITVHSKYEGTAASRAHSVCFAHAPTKRCVID